MVAAVLADAVEHADLDQMSESLLRRCTVKPACGADRPTQAASRCRCASRVDTQLVLRRHLAASVDHSGSRILVRSRAGDLAVAEDDVGRSSPADQRCSDAGDLGLDLARRLLLAGLAIAE